MGFGPFDPTGPPGSVKPDLLGSGSVNRPSPAPSLSPLSSSSSLAKPKSPLPSPGQSGHLRWPSPPMLGAKLSPQFPLPLTPIGIGGSFLSGEIWGGFPSVSTAIDRLRFGASPSLLYCACCATSGACDALVLAGGSAVVWCSRCVLGEVILGQPLAGRAGTALPCRPDEHLGDGECDFFPL
jgi:hypothetical protein